MAGSSRPSAPPSHEDTPPPQYSEVVTCPSDTDHDSHGSGWSCKTPVLLFGVILCLVLVTCLGYIVATLWVQLDTLQVRVTHKNEKEVEILQRQFQVLKSEIDKQKIDEDKIHRKLDLLSRRIDGLQDAFKTGDVTYIISEATILVTNKSFLYHIMLMFVLIILL